MYGIFFSNRRLFFKTKVEDIYSAHFTLCQKPWGCHLNSKTHCKVLHDEWFYVRERLEVEVLGGGENNIGRPFMLRETNYFSNG